MTQPLTGGGQAGITVKTWKEDCKPFGNMAIEMISAYWSWARVPEKPLRTFVTMAIL
jgi:hypothetical protein